VIRVRGTSSVQVPDEAPARTRISRKRADLQAATQAVVQREPEIEWATFG
jgi:hypothetical protein